MDFFSTARTRLIPSDRGERRELFGGRLECGPNPWNIVITVFIVIITWIFSMYYTFQYFSHLYWMIVFSFVLRFALVILILITAFIEPGIIEKDKDVEEYMENSAPVKVVYVNLKPIVTVWCASCRIYKPPRSKHCRYCDICIKRFDHHCPWISNCIGYKNYKAFIFLCLTSYIDGIINLYSILKIFTLLNTYNKIIDTLFYHPFIIIPLVLHLLQMLLFGTYVGYLFYLISTNKTINEDFTKTLDACNPHDKGFINNWLEFIRLPLIPL